MSVWRILSVLAGLVWVAAGVMTWRQTFLLAQIATFFCFFVASNLVFRPIAPVFRLAGMWAFTLLCLALAFVGKANAIDRLTTYTWIVTAFVTAVAIIVAWRAGKLKKPEEVRTPPPDLI